MLRKMHKTPKLPAIHRLVRAMTRKKAMEANCHKYGKLKNYYTPPFMPHSSYEESMRLINIEVEKAKKQYDKTYMPNHYCFAKERWPKHQQWLTWLNAKRELYNHFKLINFHIKCLDKQSEREMK